MKAYKAFNINENGDLQCRDIIYKVGATYEMDESPLLYRKGFHACLDINDLVKYYNIIRRHGLIFGKTVICEVELLGGVDEDYRDSQVATNKIKIVCQLSVEETLSRLAVGEDYLNKPEISMILCHSINDLTSDQLDVILQTGDVHLIKGILEKHSIDDYLLDKIVNHPQYKVRKLLLLLNIYRDKDLDILVHDKYEDVRAAVANRGRDKDLDILVHDSKPFVRFQVAKRGRDKDLDVLIHDKHDDVKLLANYIKKWG